MNPTFPVHEQSNEATHKVQVVCSPGKSVERHRVCMHSEYLLLIDRHVVHGMEDSFWGRLVSRVFNWVISYISTWFYLNSRVDWIIKYLFIWNHLFMALIHL